VIQILVKTENILNIMTNNDLVSPLKKNYFGVFLVDKEKKSFFLWGVLIKYFIGSAEMTKSFLFVN